MSPVQLLYWWTIRQQRETEIIIIIYHYLGYENYWARIFWLVQWGVEPPTPPLCVRPCLKITIVSHVRPFFNVSKPVPSCHLSGLEFRVYYSICFCRLLKARQTAESRMNYILRSGVDGQLEQFTFTSATGALSRTESISLLYVRGSVVLSPMKIY